MKRPCSCRVVTEFVQNSDPSDFCRNVGQMEAYIAEGILELYAANCPVEDVPFHVAQEDYYVLMRCYRCPRCGKGFLVGWCCRGQPILKEDKVVAKRNYIRMFYGQKPVGKFFERPQCVLKRIWQDVRNGMRVEAEMIRHAGEEKQ